METPSGNVDRESARVPPRAWALPDRPASISTEPCNAAHFQSADLRTRRARDGAHARPEHDLSDFPLDLPGAHRRPDFAWRGRAGLRVVSDVHGDQNRG